MFQLNLKVLTGAFRATLALLLSLHLLQYLLVFLRFTVGWLYCRVKILLVSNGGLWKLAHVSTCYHFVIIDREVLPFGTCIFLPLIFDFRIKSVFSEFILKESSPFKIEVVFLAVQMLQSLCHHSIQVVFRQLVLTTRTYDFFNKKTEVLL